MMIIGVVGGIGSGKSLVSRELARHGGCLIQGDVLGHEALREPEIKKKIVERFCRGMLDESGEIERRRLGHKVFADVKELRALEAIVFPYIVQRLCEEIAKAKADPAIKMIVVDAAVMMEAGWDRNCDRILFVDAPRELRLRRLLEKRGWSECELAERESAQWPLEEKRRRADAVIDNATTPAQVTAQIEALLGQWGIA